MSIFLQLLLYVPPLYPKLFCLTDLGGKEITEARADTMFDYLCYQIHFILKHKCYDAKDNRQEFDQGHGV